MKRSSPEINIPDIREMFRRQEEMVNERTTTKLLELISLCVIEKNISKRYTLSCSFNSSSSDSYSFCQLGDYYFKGNNFLGN